LHDFVGLFVSVMIGIHAPAAVDTIHNEHACKNIAKIGADLWQKIFCKQQKGTQNNIKSRHGYSENKQRVAEFPGISDTIVGRHNGVGVIVKVEKSDAVRIEVIEGY
jgi:hypothetical protein